MAVFKSDFRGTKEVTLKKSGGTLTLFDGFLTEHIDEFQGQKAPLPSRMIEMLIKDWDFVNEEGMKVTIDQTHIQKLPAEDLLQIITEADLTDFLEGAQAISPQSN